MSTFKRPITQGNPMNAQKIAACILGLLILGNPAVRAGGRKVPVPPPPRATLPQEHAYQKQLRAFMATLSEKDFTHGVKEPITSQPTPADAEYQYRQHLFTLMAQPLVGTKRGAPAVNAPPALFVLSALERPEGVHVPPVCPEALIAFVTWKQPGNPYYHNRALKLRAFVTASIHLMMLDDQLEHHPERGGSRSDWFGSQLILFAHPYAGFKDQLPVDVQKAYETGLRRMGQRVFDWGPEGEEPNLEVVATVGLWYVSQALKDPAFTKDAEAYARRLFTDPQHFHPAGFFLDQRGIDMGYQGMSNFFATWAALASDWPFAKDAVTRCYRLRAHLCLPEPDGRYIGPTHFNSRTSSDAWGDQWEWGIARDSFASLVTDEAVYLNKLPTADDLRKAPDQRASAFRQQLAENPVNPKGGGFLKNEQLTSHPWRWRLWQSFNFPATVNYGYEFYPPGSHAKRLKLQDENSPWLKSPFLRTENFVRDFAGAFTVAKQNTYAAIVHGGPIGYPSLEDGHFKFAGPLGFGGGQLSAFWTPTTGAVILGRRGGNSWDKSFDLVEDWRLWPLHAVSGAKYNGKVFTSARIRQPEVITRQDKNASIVKITGTLPAEQLGQGKVLEGRIQLTRTFTFDSSKVRIETSANSTGQDKVTELYETIPIFLKEAGRQAKEVATIIELQSKGQWAAATTEYQDHITAVKLTRFGGSVRITFDRPQRIKLSPEDWTDRYLSKAQCRNLMIDLLDGAAMPVVWHGEKSVSYQIEAISR